MRLLSERYFAVFLSIDHPILRFSVLYQTYQSLLIYSVTSILMEESFFVQSPLLFLFFFSFLFWVTFPICHQNNNKYRQIGLFDHLNRIIDSQHFSNSLWVFVRKKNVFRWGLESHFFLWNWMLFIRGVW